MLIILAGFFYIRYRDRDKNSVDQVQNEIDSSPVDKDEKSVDQVQNEFESSPVDKDKKSVDQVQAEFEDFPVYGLDSQTWETEIMYYFKIKRDLSVAGKIESLADQLSERKFKALPIKVSLVEKENGQTIGVVNLLENEDYSPGLSWNRAYFQGSSGGASTSTTLIKTFIQNDYKGDWVDGIVFKYEGGHLIDFDHVGLLTDTIWHETR